jgi:hypothetical protein
MIERLGDRGVALARDFLQSHGGSTRVASALSFVVDSITPDVEAVGRVTVPFYWAVYVHDGRGPVHAKPGGYLCFFPEHRHLDPRTNGTNALQGTTVKPRRLRPDEFYSWLQVNRERAERGLPPIMVVTKRVGPAKGIPFMDMGLKGLPAAASQILPTEFQLLLRRKGLLGPPSRVLLGGQIG